MKEIDVVQRFRRWRHDRFYIHIDFGWFFNKVIFIDSGLKADAFGAWPYATDFGGQKLKKDQTNMANIDRA